MTKRILQWASRGLAWLPKMGLVLSSTAALVVLGRAVWGPVGFERQALLRAEVARVEADNQQLQATLEALNRQIVVEKERPDVQEKLVRELLGYVRIDEHILKLSR